MTEKGRRNDETDLFGKPGGYVRVMDSHAAGKPCPECGATVQKYSIFGRGVLFLPEVPVINSKRQVMV